MKLFFAEAPSIQVGNAHDFVEDADRFDGVKRGGHKRFLSDKNSVGILCEILAQSVGCFTEHFAMRLFDRLVVHVACVHNLDGESRFVIFLYGKPWAAHRQVSAKQNHINTSFRLGAEAAKAGLLCFASS